MRARGSDRNASVSPRAWFGAGLFFGVLSLAFHAGCKPKKHAYDAASSVKRFSRDPEPAGPCRWSMCRRCRRQRHPGNKAQRCSRWGLQLIRFESYFFIHIAQEERTANRRQFERRLGFGGIGK